MRMTAILFSLIFSLYNESSSAIFGFLKSNSSKDTNVSQEMTQALNTIRDSLNETAKLFSVVQKTTESTLRLERVRNQSSTEEQDQSLIKAINNQTIIMDKFEQATKIVENLAISMQENTKTQKTCPQPKALKEALTALKKLKDIKLTDSAKKALALSKNPDILKLNQFYTKLILARQGYETTLSGIQKNCR